MYNMAEAWGLFSGGNPVMGVKFLPENNEMLRTLSEQEEAALLANCSLYLQVLVHIRDQRRLPAR